MCVSKSLLYVRPYARIATEKNDKKGERGGKNRGNIHGCHRMLKLQLSVIPPSRLQIQIRANKFGASGKVFKITTDGEILSFIRKAFHERASDEQMISSSHPLRK